MKTVAAQPSSVTGEDSTAAPAEVWRERSARLYEDLRRPARAMIRRAFGSAFGDDEIEDVYGNAWLGTLRALERRHAALEDEEIRKYVLTAVAHHASKELRRRARRPTAPLDRADAVADGGSSPDECVTGLEESRVTRDLLASLPPRRRAVMLLRYGWGLDPSQVCGLIDGLSARAYRKEITRGVDELTEKLRLVERGEWCAEREPILKAYAAGLADTEQERQARHHLAHCRPCTEFVGRLNGHLHEVGASLAAPGTAQTLLDGKLSVGGRLGHLADRVRETLPNPLGGRGEGAVEGGSQIANAAARARGAGVAGGGVLAKLGTLGSAGKIAALCLGGGAATACIAAGIVPVDLGAVHTPDSREPAIRASFRTPQTPERPPVTLVPAGQPIADPDPPTSSDPPPSDPPAEDPPVVTEPVETPPPPVAPPAEQQFGVAPASGSSDSGSASSGGSSGGGGRDAATADQFGP